MTPWLREMWYGNQYQIDRDTRYVPPSLLSGRLFLRSIQKNCTGTLYVHFMPFGFRNETSVRRLFRRFPDMTVDMFIDRIKYYSEHELERGLHYSDWKTTLESKWKFVLETQQTRRIHVSKAFEGDFRILDIPDYVLESSLISLDVRLDPTSQHPEILEEGSITRADSEYVIKSAKETSITEMDIACEELLKEKDLYKYYCDCHSDAEEVHGASTEIYRIRTKEAVEKCKYTYENASRKASKLLAQYPA